MKIATPPTRGVRFVFFAFLPHIYIHAKIPSKIPFTERSFSAT
jgi:hypothetical protein